MTNDQKPPQIPSAMAIPFALCTWKEEEIRNMKKKGEEEKDEDERERRKRRM
jgi:hypothetical protein